MIIYRRIFLIGKEYWEIKTITGAYWNKSQERDKQSEKLANNWIYIKCETCKVELYVYRRKQF